MLRKLRPLAPIKWVPAGNFHITSLFIGAWPDERLNELTAALEKMPKPAAFEITIAGLHFFPNRKVLSAGVASPAGDWRTAMEHQKSPRHRGRGERLFAAFDGGADQEGEYRRSAGKRSRPCQTLSSAVSK